MNEEMCSEICALLPSTCTLKILQELESGLSPPYSSLLFLIISPFCCYFAFRKKLRPGCKISDCVLNSSQPLLIHLHVSSFWTQDSCTVLYWTVLYYIIERKPNLTLHSAGSQLIPGGNLGKENRSSKWNLVIFPMFKKDSDSGWCEWHSMAGQHDLPLCGDQVLH